MKRPGLEACGGAVGRQHGAEGQQRDGSWPNPVGPGPVFGTATACIILQIPQRYLLIFQR